MHFYYDAKGAHVAAEHDGGRYDRLQAIGG